MKISSSIFVLAILLFCFACQNDSDNSNASDVDRPLVFRSVLDAKPRMISIGLSDDQFIAYNTTDGSIYKAWKGLINMEGAVFTGAHGPQPTAVGDMYFVNKHEQPWTLTKGGNIIAAEYQYRGHKFVNDVPTLMHSLKDEASGKSVNVYETVRLEKTEKGEELNRRFSTDGLEDGYGVILRTNASSIVDKSQWTTDGKLNIENIYVVDTLPPGAVYVESNLSGGSVISYDPITNIIIFSVVDLDVNECRWPRVTVQYSNPPYDINSTVTNTGYVYGTPIGESEIVASDSLTHGFINPITQVTGWKSLSHQYQFQGGQGNYNLDFDVDGTEGLDDFCVVDTIPEGVEIRTIYHGGYSIRFTQRWS